jgi:3-oxoacyl-[acyl-carrier-protein] synthase III
LKRLEHDAQKTASKPVPLPPLLKRTSAGKIQIWQISVAFGDACTAVITTTQGLMDGKQQTYEEVISKGKNIERAKETTPYEQAMAEAQSKWDEKLNRKHYGTAVAQSEVKREIVPMLAQVYKKSLKKVHWGEKNI